VTYNIRQTIPCPMRLLGNLLLGMIVILATLSVVPFQHGPCPALTEGTARAGMSVRLASIGDIIINEVMYDPFDSETEGEWVELHNPGTVDISVTNWTISDQEGNLDFIFPAMDFPAGGYVLIHVGVGQNDTEFVNKTAEFFMGRTTTLLSNTGDDVLLSDSLGATMNFISYGQWDGASVGAVPADFDYQHSNATASEGYSLARLGDDLRSSVPTPLYPNGNDSASGIIFTEVHYYAWGDNEFFTICNPLGYAMDISSWYMTDLEGVIAFPLGTVIMPGGTLTAAQNSTNYMLQRLASPDLEYFDYDMLIPDMVTLNAIPALANAGDEVLLRTNFGTVADAFIFGTSSYIGTGWDSGPVPAQSQGSIAKRRTYADTNVSGDWVYIRQYFIGQSDFGVSSFTSNFPLTLFASPDSSFEALSAELDNATQSIWLTVYEFTSYPLAQKLLSAIGRGVVVRVFLEGAPVGGITAMELYISRKIAEAGGSVRIMTNDPDNDIHSRYTYVHAKYAVIDSDTLVIMSENWGLSGVPLPDTSGNRGWGAVVKDATTASYFADVFAEDWEPERSDSVAFDQYHSLWSAGINTTYSSQSFEPMFPAVTVTSNSVFTPVLSPDTSLSSGTILGQLASASRRVLVQEFYIYKHWGDRSVGTVETTPNLYLEAVIDAARRGCQVKVLLDATFYNVMGDDPIDNDDTVAYINAVALAEGLDMEAKLVNLNEHGFEKIHNKGLIADDSVLISSINWNLNSVTRNRETGLIIRNSGAADYFAAIFDHDWIDDLTPPFAHFSIEDCYGTNVTVWLNSNTSSDNSGIVNHTWKLDGQVVCHDPYFSHIYTMPGQYLVELTVRDFWGNAASYARALNVTAEGPSEDDGTPTDNENIGEDSAFTAMIGVLLLVPIFIFAVLVLVSLKRRR